MKNIIGNSCVSAFITNDLLHQQFINPFCWATLDFNSMYNLIKDYDKINFNNYELIKDKNWTFYTIIEKKIKIKWVHYKFSPKDNKIRIGKPDILYNKIWEYIIEKYETRTKRMIEHKIEPIFIIGSLHKGHLYTEEQIKKICKLNCPYKIIIANGNMDFSNEFPNIIFHKTKYKEGQIINGKKINNSVISEELFKNYKDLWK